MTSVKSMVRHIKERQPLWTSPLSRENIRISYPCGRSREAHTFDLVNRFIISRNSNRIWVTLRRRNGRGA